MNLFALARKLQQKTVKGKKKDEILMDSYKLAEVVKFLADMLSGGES